MEKFFIAVGNNDNSNNKKNWNAGASSGKHPTRQGAEEWAQAQVKNGSRQEFVIFEAISSIRCEIPVVKEEFKQPLLQDFSEAAE